MTSLTLQLNSRPFATSVAASGLTPFRLSFALQGRGDWAEVARVEATLEPAMFAEMPSKDLEIHGAPCLKHGGYRGAEGSSSVEWEGFIS